MICGTHRLSFHELEYQTMAYPIMNYILDRFSLDADVIAVVDAFIVILCLFAHQNKCLQECKGLLISRKKAIVFFAFFGEYKCTYFVSMHTVIYTNRVILIIN